MSQNVDLRNFGYAPGNYLIKCEICYTIRNADKRATTCWHCANALKLEFDVAKRDRAAGHVPPALPEGK